MIKAIIFDQDGTLIDSKELALQWWNAAAKQVGLRVPDRKEWARNMGREWHEFVEVLWPGTDPEIFSEIWDSKPRPEYDAVPGAIGTIIQLKKKGLKIGVITGKWKDQAVIEIKHAGFDPSVFEFYHGGDTTNASKPDGKVFDLALTVLGVEDIKKDEIVYVGDSVCDMLAARDAGIKFIGVLTGFADEEDFDGVEVIDSVADLVKVLK